MTEGQNLLIKVSRERQIEFENLCIQKNMTFSELFGIMLSTYTTACLTEKPHKEPEELKIFSHICGKEIYEKESEKLPAKRGRGRPPKVQ
jgi:hypothetical protein